MSLQIWLPFNGNSKNYGLIADSEITQTTAPVYVQGPFGQALSTGGFKLSAQGTASVLNNKAVTIAFWIYPNAEDGTSSSILFGTNGMIAPNNRKFTVFIYPTVNDIHWSWQNEETNKTFTSGAIYDCLPSYTWNHVCLTYDGATCTVYVNGEKKKASTGVSASTTFEYDTQLIHSSSLRYICDFRLYDNCLTPREVQYLSQALCLHYPCNDPCPTASRNRYSGVNYDGKASSAGGWTITPLVEERGYNYKFTYTGTGSNAWKSFSFPVITDHTFGAKYLFSCKVRKHSTTHVLYMRPARIGNDYGTSNINITTATDEEWHEFSKVLEMPETFERSGTTYNVQPRIEFYTVNMQTADTTYSWDFDLKDMMIAEIDSKGLYAQAGDWADGTVYDCSGLMNNGSTTTSTAPKTAIGSPRYDACYHFESKQYLTGKMPFGANVTHELTVSAWLKQLEGSGGYSTWFACNGYSGKGLWLGINTESKGQWAYQGSTSPYYCKGGSTIALDTWHLHTYTYKNGVATWYLDGVQMGTTTYANSGLTLKSTFTLGDSYTGSSWNTTFIGDISDLRIFGKALSQAEIKEMYTLTASLIDSGTFLLGGELIE